MEIVNILNAYVNFTQDLETSGFSLAFPWSPSLEKREKKIFGFRVCSQQEGDPRGVCSQQEGDPQVRMKEQEAFPFR